MGPAGKAGDGSGDGRCNDDAALIGLFEIGNGCLDGVEGALEVGVNHFVPLFAGHILQPGGRKNSGIGTDYVYAAILVGHVVECRFQAFH